MRIQQEILLHKRFYALKKVVHVKVHMAWGLLSIQHRKNKRLFLLF